MFGCQIDIETTFFLHIHCFYILRVFDISPESVNDHNLFRCLLSLINVLVECGMKENVTDIDHLLMSDVIAVRIIGGGGGLSSQLVNEVIVKENR